MSAPGNDLWLGQRRAKSPVYLWSMLLALYRVSLVYIFSLHHQEGYLVLHLSTGKDQDTESDPARLLSHAKSARGSRTT